MLYIQVVFSPDFLRNLSAIIENLVATERGKM